MQEKSWSYKDCQDGREKEPACFKKFGPGSHISKLMSEKKKISGKMAFSEHPPSSLVRKGGFASESQQLGDPERPGVEHQKSEKWVPCILLEVKTSCRPLSGCGIIP